MGLVLKLSLACGPRQSAAALSQGVIQHDAEEYGQPRPVIV